MPIADPADDTGAAAVLAADPRLENLPITPDNAPPTFDAIGAIDIANLPTIKAPIPAITAMVPGDAFCKALLIDVITWEPTEAQSTCENACPTPSNNVTNPFMTRSIFSTSPVTSMFTIWIAAVII